MDKGALFASFVACRQRGLRDLFTGGKLVLQETVDRHHILPRAQFSERKRAAADTVANIAFISGSTNKSIGSPSPEVYLRSLSRQTLKSQCIPVDEKLWRISAAEEFWEARRELLSEAFNECLKAALPNRRTTN